MKNRHVFLMTLMQLALAVTFFANPTYATTKNGVTCNLFISVQNGAINWPVNGNLYYCGNNFSSDSAGVSVAWQAAQGATQRVVGAQVVPFLRQVFTNTHVELYVFGTAADFEKYFDYTFTPPAGATVDDIAGLTAKRDQVPSHPDPFSAIFQYSPAISGPSDNRLLLIAQTTNHEMGFEMDDYYGNPSTHSENYANALVKDIQYVNKLTCLEVFGVLVGEACVPNLSNWQRMVKLWPFDTLVNEFFANAFAADSPNGVANAPLGTIIHNDFLNTVDYLRGLRTGTGKP